MKNNTVVNFSTARAGCYNCCLSQLCPSADTKIHNVENLDKLIKRNQKFERGEYIYRTNQAFSTVYAIRSGSVKTYTSIENGKEQVTGFHLPGELLGLDSISTHYHTDSAMALETCSICEIPFDRLENISVKNPAMQHALLYAMSEEIQNDHRQLTLVSKMPAEIRLANFLLNISSHFKERGYSATDFNLSMTRSDIANLLGLAVETISRIFSQFQEKGLLTVERKHIVLRDAEGLKSLSLNYSSYSRPGYMLHDKAS